MLVLSRKVGETIHIGSSLTIKVTAIKGGRVQIGIEAPREVGILRGELGLELNQVAPQIIAPVSDASGYDDVALPIG